VGSSSEGEEEEEHRSRSTVRRTANSRKTGNKSDRGSRSRSYDIRSSRRQAGAESSLEDDDEDDSTGSPVATTLTHVLGYRAESLASLLNPSRSLCKAKFELGVEDLVFLGYPVHVKTDGTWQRKRRKRRHENYEDKIEDGDDSLGEEEENEGNEADDEDDPKSPELQKQATKPDRPETISPSQDNASKMSLFHVVFVMNPPQLEYHARVDDMYEHVVKSFSRALKREQAHDNYVAKEADSILDIKEKALNDNVNYEDLWAKIIAKSNLADAIAKVYNAISTSQIAHIVLNHRLDFSMQIPIISETSVLPSAIEPQFPGLPLTTVTSFGNDFNYSKPDRQLVPFFALLFLEDGEDIMKEVVPDDPANGKLIQFLRYHHPTQTLQTIAQTSGLEYLDVEYLARYLIRWRKARPIPPLSHRNCYIVSPNADMRKVASQTSIFKRLFPMIKESLPEMLSKLSGKPRTYSFFIPSRDHRIIYMETLAWLMRHGWIIQLRSFAYLKITRNIKTAVAKENKESDNEQSIIITSSYESNDKDQDKGKQLSKPASNDNIASLLNTEDNNNDTSVVVKQNSIDIKNNEEDNDIDPTDDEDTLEESILLDPRRPTPLESAWLSQLVKDSPPDIVALSDRMVKYLDGHQAIEKIAIREGITTGEVKRVKNAIKRNLVDIKHW